MFELVLPEGRRSHLVETVWAVRAASKAAAVRFGRGEDSAALQNMKSVAASTGPWLRGELRSQGAATHQSQTAATWWSRASRLGTAPTLAASLRDVVSASTTEDVTQLLHLINLGADDLVDAPQLASAVPTHTEFAPAAAAAFKALIGWGYSSQQTGAGGFASVENLRSTDGLQKSVECLERVKCMTRQHHAWPVEPNVC